MLIPALQKHVIQKPSTKSIQPPPSWDDNNPVSKKKTHTEFNDERATFEETVSVSPPLNGFLAHHTNILPPPGEIQVTQTISTNLNASNLKAQHEQRQRGKNPAMTSVIESWLDNRASLLMAYERP